MIKVIGPITDIRIIATGRGVRIRCYLRKAYGGSRWRKMKGVARVRLRNGQVRRVELHWYEAQGVGRRDFKIKRYLDEP